MCDCGLVQLSRYVRIDADRSRGGGGFRVSLLCAGPQLGCAKGGKLVALFLAQLRGALAAWIRWRAATSVRQAGMGVLCFGIVDGLSVTDAQFLRRWARAAMRLWMVHTTQRRDSGPTPIDMWARVTAVQQSYDTVRQSAAPAPSPQVTHGALPGGTGVQTRESPRLCCIVRCAGECWGPRIVVRIWRSFCRHVLMVFWKPASSLLDASGYLVFVCTAVQACSSVWAICFLQYNFNGAFICDLYGCGHNSMAPAMCVLCCCSSRP